MRSADEQLKNEKNEKSCELVDANGNGKINEDYNTNLQLKSVMTAYPASAVKVYPLSLESQCICSAPVSSSNPSYFLNSHFFMTGSSSTLHENYITVIEYLDNNCDFGNIFKVPFDEQILSLNPIFFLINKNENRNVEEINFKILASSKKETNLEIVNRCRYFEYKLSNLDNPELNQQFDFIPKIPFYKIKRLLRDPHNEDSILIVDNLGFERFNFYKPINKNEVISRGRENRLCRSASFDPHHAELVGVVQGNTLLGWDFRSNDYSYKRNNTNGVQIFDIDFNPNYLYSVVTAEENGCVNFYDLRKLQNPIHIIVDAHSHWVTRCRFNDFHSQLVITAGTDGSVKLWDINISTSNTTVLIDKIDYQEQKEKDEVKQNQFEELVQHYDEHADSVYDLCWSATDSWCFGSVSNSKKIAIHTVPTEEKYKILL